MNEDNKSIRQVLSGCCNSCLEHIPFYIGDRPYSIKWGCVGMTTILEEQKKSFQFNDTIAVLGYTNEGEKLRGRPRGSVQKDPPTLFPEIEFSKRIGVVIKNNRQLLSHAQNDEITKLILDGWTVTIILRDSSIIKI